MKNKNSIDNIRTIDDKRTLGTRNIPFFWNSKRYYRENIYHCSSTSLFLIGGIIFITVATILIVFASQNKETYSLPWVPTMCFIIFPCLFFGVVFKLNERKIRKQRIWDLTNAHGREIEIK
jgi:fucose 4-O-acetylase-like acetyltransferase